MLKDITVSFAPHISKPLSTRSVMVDVIIGLVPVMAAACYYFRTDTYFDVRNFLRCGRMAVQPDSQKAQFIRRF